MAKISMGIASSHGPSIQNPVEHWQTYAEKDARDTRFDYAALLKRAPPGLEKEIALSVQRDRHTAAQAALTRIAASINAAKPDVIVIVTNAHMVSSTAPKPVFSILRAASFGVSEFNGGTFEDSSRSQKVTNSVMPGHPGLANHLLRGLVENDFDVACIDKLPDGEVLDEAFGFCYKWLFPNLQIPVVPIYLSRDLPNQPTPSRCIDFGRQLGSLISSYEEGLKVAVIASGGLSHQIVDEETDRFVLDCLSERDWEKLRNLSIARLNAAPGTPETLNWLCVAAAMDPLKMDLINYLPCYRSLASTGHGVAFAEWHADD